MTKRVCQRATPASLPCAVLRDILAMLKNQCDVVAYLAALPGETLPPELIALRDLGAAVDLADHWPVVHIAKIPIEHTRLGMAALPAFAGVYVDAGFTALDWLDAKLPPQMPLTLVIDPAVSGAVSAFAYNWGNRVTNAIVKGRKVQPDPIPDLLRRCVNVESVRMQEATPAAMTTYLTALPTQRLHTLTVLACARGAIDTSTIVSWLQRPHATSLSLRCSAVPDPTALANAILACTTLRSLSLFTMTSVHEALMASPKSLSHITSLILIELHDGDGAGPRLVKKLDRSTLLSFGFDHCNIEGFNDEDNPPETDVLDTLSLCFMLQNLRLVRIHVAPITTRGVWSHLSAVVVRDTTFEAPGDAGKFIQWLSTSRCLTSVDLSRTKLGQAGFVELARAVPAWMDRGLQSLNLRGTHLGDDDAAILVVALASGKNLRPLTVNLASNPFSEPFTKLFLAMMGATHNVTLHICTSRFTANIQTCVQLHQLVQVQPGIVKSPPRSSSPWYTT